MSDPTPPTTHTITSGTERSNRFMSNASSIPGAAANHPYHTSDALAQQPNPSAASVQAPDASSIFERNVQEPSVPDEISPAIPSHIKTEDMIPPALEASSLAITDDQLRPDEVEIVTHASHQPAAATIAESVSAPTSESYLPLSPPGNVKEELPAATQYQDTEDSAPNYGALDPNDVRRLSFISFADVIQAEHAESGSSQSLHHVPLMGSHHRPQSRGTNRSASPARSPVSSTPGVNSPRLGSGLDTVRGELSPVRSPVGSPSLGGPQQHGELAIETMSQALKRSASRDLGSISRPIPASPTSPVAGEDNNTGKATIR